MRTLPILIVVSAFIAIAVPTWAFAAPGNTTADVHMRAGPSIEYPIVTTIPEGAEVEIHGCLEERDWCDVTWDGYRGWVSAHYLEYLYEGHYVYLPDYFEVVHVPIISFVLGTYWEEHYRSRPWFQRRSYWEQFWRTHRHPSVRPQPGTQLPAPAVPKPSVTTPEHRIPTIRTPERRIPSITVPQRRTPSTQSGTPQQAPQQQQVPQQLQAPRRSVTTPHPTTRSGSSTTIRRITPPSGSGGTIQRTTPSSGAAAPSGQPTQRRRHQQ